MKNARIVTVILFAVFATGQVRTAQAFSPFWSSCATTFLNTKTLLSVGVLGAAALVAYWAYKRYVAKGAPVVLPVVMLPEVVPSELEKREPIPLQEAKRSSEPEKPQESRESHKTAKSVDPATIATAGSSEVRATAEPTFAMPVQDTNQRNLLIINDLMDWERGHWTADRPWGGACTWSLFLALRHKRTPIYVNKFLLSYISASDFGREGESAESACLLKDDWKIYDINQEYCLLVPVRWLDLYKNTKLGYGFADFEKLVPVTVANICEKLFGKATVTKKDVATWVLGSAEERKRYLWGTEKESGLAAVLSGRVQWNIGIMGHGGEDTSLKTRFPWQRQGLVGMPRQTFISLLDNLAGKARMVYFCTCYGASEISDAAFDSRGIERIFAFPVMGSVCADGESSAAFFDDELLGQFQNVEKLDKEHEQELFAACVKINKSLTPSIRWAREFAFEPLQGSTPEVTVISCQKLDYKKVTREISPKNVTVLLDGPRDTILPQGTTRVVLVHMAGEKSVCSIKNFALPHGWSIEKFLRALKPACASSQPRYLLIDVLVFDPLGKGRDLLPLNDVKIKINGDTTVEAYWKCGPAYWAMSERAGFEQTEITAKEFGKKVKDFPAVRFA